MYRSGSYLLTYCGNRRAFSIRRVVNGFIFSIILSLRSGDRIAVITRDAIVVGPMAVVTVAATVVNEGDRFCVCVARDGQMNEAFTRIARVLVTP